MILELVSGATYGVSWILAMFSDRIIVHGSVCRVDIEALN
jgi:hypothetical protein